MRDDSYMLISAMRGFQIYVHVQHFLQGCKVKVEVFKTEKKGWGLRTLEDLESLYFYFYLQERNALLVLNFAGQ